MRVTAATAAAAPALRQPVALDDYQQAVAKRLGEVFAAPETEERTLELDAARIVIFSDHHKGARDGADDFQRCEKAYHAALGYYLEFGYELIVLGDGEELWECEPEDVIGAYGGTLGLEAEFQRQGGYLRIWGNHDDDWAAQDQVNRHLQPFYGPLKVGEAIKVRVVDRGEALGLLFLTHGHQGTSASDRFRGPSRLVVRYAWRPIQRRVGFASTTPAMDFDLRGRHDRAMFTWAYECPAKPVLIAGHTHKPVFWTSLPPVEPGSAAKDLERQLAELRASPRADREAIASLRARLEFVRVEARRDRPTAIDPPCYFNTGCCSFGDGDVTGIEVAGNDIRLVRWPNDGGQPLPQVLASASVREVLARVAAPR